jgi:hypothetical protein
MFSLGIGMKCNARLLGKLKTRSKKALLLIPCYEFGIFQIPMSYYI